MAFNDVKTTLCLCVLVLYSLIEISDQAIYPYAQAAVETLNDLDLNSLKGQWFGVYHRFPKGKNETCPQLNITVGIGYVNVTESRGQKVTTMKMEQNNYLKGKIAQIIPLPAGYSVERPWFIVQTNPTLVVYQVTTGNNEDDNWSVYSRSRTPDKTAVDFAAKKLVDAGAEVDLSGNFGYKCTD